MNWFNKVPEAWEYYAKQVNGLKDSAVNSAKNIPQKAQYAPRAKNVMEGIGEAVVQGTDNMVNMALSNWGALSPVLRAGQKLVTGGKNEEVNKMLTRQEMVQKATDDVNRRRYQLGQEPGGVKLNDVPTHMGRGLGNTVAFVGSHLANIPNIGKKDYWERVEEDENLMRQAIHNPIYNAINPNGHSNPLVRKEMPTAERAKGRDAQNILGTAQTRVALKDLNNRLNEGVVGGDLTLEEAEDIFNQVQNNIHAGEGFTLAVADASNYLPNILGIGKGFGKAGAAAGKELEAVEEVAENIAKLNPGNQVIFQSPPRPAGNAVDSLTPVASNTDNLKLGLDTNFPTGRPGDFKFESGIPDFGRKSPLKHFEKGFNNTPNLNFKDGVLDNISYERIGRAQPTPMPRLVTEIRSTASPAPRVQTEVIKSKKPGAPTSQEIQAKNPDIVESTQTPMIIDKNMKPISRQKPQGRDPIKETLTKAKETVEGQKKPKSPGRPKKSQPAAQTPPTSKPNVQTEDLSGAEPNVNVLDKFFSKYNPASFDLTGKATKRKPIPEFNVKPKGIPGAKPKAEKEAK